MTTQPEVTQDQLDAGFAAYCRHADGAPFAEWATDLYRAMWNARPPAPGDAEALELVEKLPTMHRLADVSNTTIGYNSRLLANESVIAYRMIVSLMAQRDELRVEVEEEAAVREMGFKLLAEIAIVLKGEPKPLHSHDLSNLPRLVEENKLACDIGEELLRQEREAIAAARAEVAALARDADAWEEHTRLLLPLAKGYVATRPRVASTQEIVDSAAAALAQERRP